MNSKKVESSGQPVDDLRYYLACPLRKNHARIPVTVCHKQKCLFLGSKDGKAICTYAMPAGRQREQNGKK